MDERKPSIYDRLGVKGLIEVVWKSTPLPWKIIALPYGLRVYRELTKQSHNLEDLFLSHSNRYHTSLPYRVFRPRYHVVKAVLKNHGIE